MFEDFFYRLRKWEISGIPDYLEDNIKLIISGCAAGTDSLAIQYAKYAGIPVKLFPANWKDLGKAAGTIRNKHMLDEGKPDLVVAFLAPNSRGTKNMIEQATKAGVPVKVVNIEV